MYDWDEAKRRRNLAKHGVDFAEMVRFDWATAVIEEDRRYDYGETRLIATGLIGNRLHVLTYTPRSGRTRVINLRKANRREIDRWASLRT